MSNFVTIQKAAEQLSCSESHIRRLIAAGKLATIDIGLGKQKVLRVQLPEPSVKMPMNTRRRKHYKPEILTE